MGSVSTASVVLTLLLVSVLLLEPHSVGASTQISFNPTPIKTDTLRLGINLGGRDTGSHVMKNILPYPGFEASEKSTVMLAASGSNTTQFRQAQWSATSSQPDGYWNGASYWWLTGKNQGKQGTITSMFNNGGVYTFVLSPAATYTPAVNDVLVVKKNLGSSFRSAAVARTGSPGVQSYNLSVQDNGAQMTTYYDGGYRDIDYTIGKTIIISQNWTLNFWAKANVAGEQFSFYFGREQWAGGKAFFSKTYTLSSTSWTNIVENFYVDPSLDPADPAPTTPCANWPSCGRPQVQISWSKSSGTFVLIDDATLHSTLDTNPTVFSDSVVNNLKSYNPGTLRYWGGQLGATLTSQTATEFARRTNGYKPTDGTPSNLEYGLHDFLVLCQYIGADPWWVMPPTFFPSDLTGLVQYLTATSGTWANVRIKNGQSAPWTSVFKNVYIEYGNELWGGGDPNDPFGGASMGGTNEGIAGNYSFSLIRAAAGFDKSKIKLILGGQAGWSGQNQLIQNGASTHDLMGLAPYFGDLTTYDTPINKWGPLWAFSVQENISGNFRSTQQILASSGRGTGLAIYEINFGFLNPGNPLPADRNPWMVGIAGGLNLPWAMLNYLKYFGAQPSNAFTLLGYSFLYDGSAWPFQCPQPSQCSFAKPWGMLRDLDRVKTKRPTWLATELCNKAIKPNMFTTVQTGDNPTWVQSPINSITSSLTMQYINSFAFSDGAGNYSFILFNFHLSQALPVTLSTGVTPSATATQYVLASANPTDDNESSENVKTVTSTITNFANGYGLTLAPFSVTAITYKG